MPIARGWGTGGLQITLSIIGKPDVLKVIDQGADESVNAVIIKKLVHETTGVELTDRTQKATIIQSRHRMPEVPLTEEQIIVLQVPAAEPLRNVEDRELVTTSIHAANQYDGTLLQKFEQL